MYSMVSDLKLVQPKYKVAEDATATDFIVLLHFSLLDLAYDWLKT